MSANRNLIDRRQEELNREEVRRLLKVLPRYCEGFGEEDCGDELDPGELRCSSHQRDADKQELLEAMEAEGVEPMVWYPHLTDRS